MVIITFPEQQKLLNKRSELISNCRHENEFLLHYYDSEDEKDMIRVVSCDFKGDHVDIIRLF